MNKLIYIAGPCVIESQDLLFEVCEGVLESIAKSKLEVDYYFKASFDKANRSAHDSFRGPGLERGLAMLEKVRERFSVPILTDVHESHQCDVVASVVDVVQIPAFLCRQTDLLVSAATACHKYQRRLNVKKAQFLAPWDMSNVVDKVHSTGFAKQAPEMFWLTERGSTFGYNNLVVDMTSIPIMKQFGVPVVFDATHSVQLPGGAGKVTGGRREFIEPLTKAAIAVGVDGLFMETHPRPSEAKSDAANAFPLHDLTALLTKLHRLRQAL